MSLKSLIVLIVALVLGTAMLVLGVFFQRGLQDYGTATAVRAVEVRAQALGTFLSRALYEEWRDVELTAGQIAINEDPEALQVRFDALADDEGKVSWIGVARADGTVVSARDGLLVGQNVAQRPWFQAGLQGPFAGDVHEAVLLAQLLGNDGGEPLRFVDFSAPILGPGGQVTGVLGAHVDWRWVRSLVTEAAAELELDAFIVNSAGTIILATDSISDATGQLSVFRAATLGVDGTYSETWPDGQSYFSRIVPQFGYETLPDFGWRLVARIDPDFVFGAQRQFMSTMALGAVLAYLMAILAFALVLISLLRPLGTLADMLLKLAKGEPVGYVREHTRFREVNTLSEAVVRLQSGPGEGASR
ncbi:hypothetical protein EMQ25_16825 [Arsenicitalea aurantiaca]|uniref:Cache domain-containing protein n=1 Tax=Arsenicitalea aurantiaca TaxID=1783274 RepID=A0A433X2G3_9HYPH|nr:cache domain-containing protein [Arsenicitalea aurantiaca]RUT28251.1 hypothetical protein EMQ25_16825 [Arsenicitalea aurantiaca]